jgi:hypothetical protein
MTKPRATQAIGLGLCSAVLVETRAAIIAYPKELN